ADDIVGELRHLAGWSRIASPEVTSEAPVGYGHEVLGHMVAGQAYAFGGLGAGGAGADGRLEHARTGRPRASDCRGQFSSALVNVLVSGRTYMAKPLVIVESPTKAKTLGRFLGTKYRVEASYGHIRDLPESAASVPKEIKDKDWGRLGVDVESDFTPYYVVSNDKKKQVAHLKTAMKEASELLLATDPDREGEAIS